MNKSIPISVIIIYMRARPHKKSLGMVKLFRNHKTETCCNLEDYDAKKMTYVFL